VSGAPDFIEAAIGYREWVVEGQRLRSSAAVGVEWTPGTNTARCYGYGACEPAPGQHCDCGLYAVYEPPQPGDIDPCLFDQAVLVIGAVAAWGDIQGHRDGFRAQHARIVALAYPPQAGPQTIARLVPVARRFEVELVALGELAAAAAQHGKPLPLPERARPASLRGALHSFVRRGATPTATPSSFPRAGRSDPIAGWQRQVVAPTIASRRLTRDQVYLHIAQRQRVLFHLRVFEAPEQPPVVIAGNLDGNTGTSVTNAAADLAAEIATRVLPDKQFALVEHYPRRHADHAIYAEAGFTPLTFDAESRPQRGQPLTQEQVEEIVGQPVVVFPARYYTAENVELVKHAPHAQLAADALAPACPEHGRGAGGYCAEIHMDCHARHAREQRHFGPPIAPTRAWVRGSYEGVFVGDGGGGVYVRIGCHSPLKASPGSGGFGWGYGGTGAHELAAAILTDWHGHAVAPALVSDFTDQVIARLPNGQSFTLTFGQIAGWLRARPEYPLRGLVFVASMATDTTVLAHTAGFPIAGGLTEHGFEVYLPEYAVTAQRSDPFAATVLASHRGALDRASAIVLPFGLPGTAPPAVEAALALSYAQREENMTVVVAALDEGASLDGAAGHFGLLGAQVTPTPDRTDPDGQSLAAAVCQLVERAAGVQGLDDLSGGPR
jgi:small neutral amino acid transporter SnatA (MarC family)